MNSILRIAPQPDQQFGDRCGYHLFNQKSLRIGHRFGLLCKLGMRQPQCDKALFAFVQRSHAL